MIKLHADIDGNQLELKLRLEGNSVHAQVAGRSYELQFHQTTSGLVLRRGTHIYDCRVTETGKANADFEVELREKNYSVHLVDPKRLRSQQSASAHDHGLARITAPMPGKVVRLLVEVGAQVEAGAGIVVVEAMKMQNEMKSPKAGVVTSLHAAAGATVNAGDVLAEIE